MQQKIIQDHRRLAKKIWELKHKGKRIVFTSGGFNLLHVGHVRSLQEAKALGDILVVGLNSDSSIRQFKGPDHPIIPEDERMEIIAALACTDFVTLFTDKRADRLIRRLRPDVHAKGTDYTAETVPERATADRLGIRVAIVGDPKNHSTTELLQSVRKGAHD